MSPGGRGPAAGLCDTCAHQRLVPTSRTAFSLCRLSATDPRFPRYPALPVLRCAGFESRSPDVRE
jgi:hypothetical protein